MQRFSLGTHAVANRCAQNCLTFSLLVVGTTSEIQRTRAAVPPKPPIMVKFGPRLAWYFSVTEPSLQVRLLMFDQVEIDVSST